MKRILFLLSLLLAATMAMGQEITVRSFESDRFDLNAKTHGRTDSAGHACALVKVRLARPGATFRGNVLGDTPYSQSEYLVYMSQGSKKLEVRLEGFLPLTIDFRETYGYRAGLEEATTYVLTLTLPATAGQPADDGQTYLSITVTPKNASVRVDDCLLPTESDGQYILRLDRGTHSYKVEAAGYEPKQQTLTLGAERKDVEVALVSMMAQLSVTCLTQGVDIYINGKKRSGPSFDLVPGRYVVEAQKVGHHSQQTTVVLAEKEQRRVDLPELAPITGQLDVNYKPLGAAVSVDGAMRGTSPNVFKDIPVGTHRVVISKEGYQPETLTVNIEEGKTATLSGSLKAQASAAGAPATAAGASTASAGASSTGAYSSSATAPGRETFTVNGVRFTMVRVGGGTFTMGATPEQGSDAYGDEQPAHRVTLSSYSIGETEVTQELWEAVMGSNPSGFNGPKRPVEQVSWNDCQDFIRKLNAATGRRFRLPTEAEWEYAARGGTHSQGYKYAGSNNLGDVAWYDGNSRRHTHDVAQKRPNELGLYDMSGNVWEWCSDYWKNSYDSTPQTNPQGPTGGSYRVRRGGGWSNVARSCRSSYRFIYAPTVRFDYLGFRLVLSE